MRSCACGCHAGRFVKLAPHNPLPTAAFDCRCVCHARTRQPAWWAPESPAVPEDTSAAEEAAAALRDAEFERKRKLRLCSDGTIWWLASQGEHAAVARYVDNGFEDVNAPDPWTARTALHKACRAGHIKVVKVLLRRGADVNARNKHGWTPLMDACASGVEGVAELLLDSGAEVTGSGDGEGATTPMELLRRSRSTKDPLFIRLQQEHNLQAALAAPDTLVGKHIEICSRRRQASSKWKSFAVVAYDAQRAAHFVLGARGNGKWLHLSRERLRLTDTLSRNVNDNLRALAKQRPPPPSFPQLQHLGGNLALLTWAQDLSCPIVPAVDRYEVAFAEQQQGRQTIVCVTELQALVRIRHGKTYTVRVRAHNSNGWGLWSSPGLRGVRALDPGTGPLTPPGHDQIEAFMVGWE